MFEIEVISGDADNALEHRLYKDGLPWRLVSEWEPMFELTIIELGEDILVGIPVSQRMQDELRLAEDFVGPQGILPHSCEGSRRLNALSTCWAMCLPLEPPSPPFCGPGYYQFVLRMDHIETGS